MKDFVKDEYFEKGHLLLKIRETLTALALWVLLLIPLAVLINSVAPQPLWNNVYHWSYSDGLAWNHELFLAVIFALAFFAITCTLLLVRNNYRYTHVFPKKKTYDEAKLAQKTQILNEKYSQRFGDIDFRHNTAYYSVIPEKNLETNQIHDWFEEIVTPDKSEKVKLPEAQVAQVLAEDTLQQTTSQQTENVMKTKEEQGELKKKGA